MSKITVLVLIDRLACFHSLQPFLFYGASKRFDFTDSADYCLKEDKNEVLVMVRQFIKPDIVDTELLAKLRAKYRRIAFFHDDAGGGIPRLEVLPYVDLFYSKALFLDRSLYKRSLYGKELYSDYYHEKYHIDDEKARVRPVVSDDAELAKLRLSWNVGIGDYPRGKLRQRIGTGFARLFSPAVASAFYSRKPLPVDPVAGNRGTYSVHARIGLTSRATISYQRKLILDRIEGDDRFLVGMVSQSQYNEEVAHSRIVLSPFGWGELCLRDFEAVRSGALLLKPDMAHLETWPDVFKNDETYAAFSWDADDILERTSFYLDNESERRRVASNAWETYRAQLSDLENRFEAIMTEVAGE